MVEHVFTQMWNQTTGTVWRSGEEEETKDRNAGWLCFINLHFFRSHRMTSITHAAFDIKCSKQNNFSIIHFRLKGNVKFGARHLTAHSLCELHEKFRSKNKQTMCDEIFSSLIKTGVDMGRLCLQFYQFSETLVREGT